MGPVSHPVGPVALPPNGADVDPELAIAVPLIPDFPFTELDGSRRALDELIAAFPVDLSGVHVQDRLVPGPAGAPDVPVRIFTPLSADPGVQPGVLDIHGGGFALGMVALDDAANAAIARDVGAVVVSVDYRLAPEHPFPAPAEDCYAALVWFAGHAAELGVDPARIAVLGDSAGGGLAATTALLARDRGGPALAMQVLIEPELDDRLDTHSMRTGADTVGWNNAQAAHSWRYYLGGRPATDVRRAGPDGRPVRAAADLPDRQRAGLPARRGPGVRPPAAGRRRLHRTALLAGCVPRLRHPGADGPGGDAGRCGAARRAAPRPAGRRRRPRPDRAAEADRTRYEGGTNDGSGRGDRRTAGRHGRERREAAARDDARGGPRLRRACCASSTARARRSPRCARSGCRSPVATRSRCGCWCRRRARLGDRLLPRRRLGDRRAGRVRHHGAGSWPSAPARWSRWSTTGSPPSTATRPRPRTPGPR